MFLVISFQIYERINKALSTFKISNKKTSTSAASPFLVRSYVFLFNLMAACCVFLGSILLAIILLIFFYSPDLPKFQVLNPNLVTDFFYHDVNCSVYHDKDHLASTMSPGFVHPARETRQISVTVHLTPGTTARGIGDDLATYDFTEFDVKLTILVKSLFRSSEFVEVSCDDVTVGLLPTIGGHGKMIGPARICQVS